MVKSLKQSETNNSEASIELINLPEKDFIGEREWFFLYWIAKLAQKNHGEISTPDLCKSIKISQQTISRRIIDLEKGGFLTRNFKKNRTTLKITPKGIIQLENIHHSLQKLLAVTNYVYEYQGLLKSGMGEGAYYIQLPQYLEQFQQKLGFIPYIGTLNLQLSPDQFERFNNDLKDFDEVIIEGFSNGLRTYGNVRCYKAIIWPAKEPKMKVQCGILIIQRTSHQPTTIEIIAEKFLRKHFAISDNEELVVNLLKNYPE
jgi:riboflavin kinase